MIRKIIEVNKGGYSIILTGATISTNQIVRDVLISIQEREYTIDLIILPGLAIDVILGMNWMRVMEFSLTHPLKQLC